MSVTAKGSSRLSAQKRALLEAKRNEKGIKTPAQERIPRRGPEVDHLPLSFSQQRLWFLDRLVPDNAFYNMAAAMRLDGALNVRAMLRAFDEIVQRHESLRTTFVAEGGQPRQVVAPVTGQGAVRVPRFDLSGLAPAVAEGELQRLARQEARRPHDLAVGPLVRIHLLRVHATQHAILLNIHHIVSDGWSTGILFRELAVLYEAYGQGKTVSPLAALPIQYPDYALWQRRFLSGQELERQLAYWRQALEGAPEVLDLPFDRPRRPVETFRGALTPLRFTAIPVRRLRDFAQRHGATLSMVLQGGFAAVLARYANQRDVVLGSAIANRNRAELEGLIGFFANTLLLRNRLEGNPGFGAVLGRVRESSLGAYAHQDIPFEKLVESLDVERDLAHNPLAQVMYGFQNFDRTVQQLPGLEVTRLREGGLDAGTAKFDLTLFLWESGDEVLGLLEHNRDLFDQSTIDRFLGHFHAQLEQGLRDSETSVFALPVLSPAEARQLTVEWADTTRPYPQNAGLAQLFEAQVERTPEHLALVFPDEAASDAAADSTIPAGGLKYRELNARANRLAHHLIALGVGRETPVALALERSTAMVVAMLAVLKAGGSYVPLDPAYPAARLAFMLEDSQVPVLVTVGKVDPALTGGDAGALSVVHLEHDGAAIDQRPDTNPPPVASGDNLAYVIYTSGSTGRPKGVAVPQYAVARLVLNTDYVRVQPDDRIAQASNASFDAATFELWGALLNGAALVGVSKEVALSPAAYARRIREYGITTLFTTTALFNQLVREPGIFGPLRHVLFGGEAVDPGAVRHLLGDEPPERLLHVYGPTESTTYASWERVVEVAPDAATVPIGGPLANTALFVLDPTGHAAPLGVGGELVIGGDGLARGYLRRPALTAEKFVPNPLGPPGSRLYRTGDLARWRPQRTIEFMGRIDHQVKVRGFRIELGEIEALLLDHGAVEECIVLAREDEPGNRQLVAYVVQAPEAASREAAAGEDTDDDSVGEFISDWQTLYEDLYERGRGAEDAAFNIVGWGSTYTGEDLPADEMREWLIDTTAGIRALAPKRVLEIGVGTGLLLFQIAPEAEYYHGLDFSATVLDWLSGPVGKRFPEGKVVLEQRLADELEGIPERAYDTVLINSVAQYFPSIDYMVSVVEQAVERVVDGGAVFIGDVRSLPLLDAFHASVELSRAADDLPIDQLRQHVRAQRLQETELVMDPLFFFAAAARIPRITGVEIRPKTGRADNELTRFRYQVVLRVGAPETAATGEDAPAVEWWDWTAEGLSLERLRRRIEDAAEGAPARIGLAEVPNPRLLGSVAAAELLFEGGLGSELETAGDLKERVGTVEATATQGGGVELEDLRQLAETLGYTLDFGWNRQDRHGSYDAVLTRRGVAAGDFPFPQPDPSRLEAPWSRYANNPLLGKFSSKIVPALRAFLDERVPEYMVPAAFVLMEALPLNANGKVDRKALPAPDFSRSTERAAYVAPRTAVEERLEGILKEVLNLEQVGVEDDFFAIGGHSLLATQVISRAREAFEIELPLQALFEAPTVAGLALKVEELVAAKGGLQAPPVTAVPRQAGVDLPLSFAQQRLFFLMQLEPGNPFYNVPAAFRVRGRARVTLLEQVFTEIVRRHEVLRTRFRLEGDGAVQEIDAPAPFPVPVVDLSGLAPERRAEEAHRLAAREAATPFDLERDAVLRVRMLELGAGSAAGDQAVLVTMHHIASDGWSLSVLVREMVALYTAFAQGQPSPLPELAIQYADFAVWQRRWMAGDALAEQLHWWRQELAGVPTVLDLPTDKPRPPVQDFAGARATRRLSRELHGGLEALARRAGATPFMVLLAAFETLLMRITGQSRMILGSPIANRNRSEIEPLIGFFINTLALAGDLTGNPPFHDLLARVRAKTLGAYAHQDLPFEKLVEALAPERDLSRSPLFQVLFVLQNNPQEVLELPGLVLESMGGGNRSVKFDLSFNLVENPEGEGGEHGLGLLMNYRTSLFDAPTMERLLGHFENLLEGVVADPARRLRDLSLLSPAEEDQLLWQWNDTAWEYPLDRPLHHWITAQAAATPEAVALVFEGETWSYGWLEAASNRLAHHLVARAVGPEVLVAVACERSPRLLVALLAVLKAGGAYVPLDPGYPEERLRFLLEDSQPAVVLTEGVLESRLATVFGDHPAVLRVEEDGPWRELDGSAPPAVTVWPESPAYTIYTSGSTGRPKGAVNRHQSIVNRLLWMQRTFPLTAEDRVLHKTPFSFDVSVWELFWPLMVGAGMVIARPEGHRDGTYLVALIVETGVTTVHFVPSMLRAFLEQPEVGRCTSLKRVIASGEALPGELQERFYATGLSAELHNLYGPTEAAVDVSHWACRPGVAPNLGRPIDNLRLHVLDPAGRPVPVGAPGELAIGGVGLARGYLDRPALTAARFVADPVAREGAGGGRLYRTGDRARYLADGNVEFLGRLDHQLKLRGHRIELGEIEARIAEHPAVAAAVVVPQGEGLELRLVAFVVAEPSPQTPLPKGEGLSELPLGEVRAWLQERLPEPLVPTLFTAVEALPLTPNGKVDRRALAARTVAVTRSEDRPFLAPRTPAEEWVAGLFGEVLEVEKVGVEDHFFDDLGGHSILGAVVINRLQKALGEIVHVVAIFDRPTVAQLAEYLETQHPEAMARRFGGAVTTEAPTPAAPRIDAARLAQFREAVAVRHAPTPLVPLEKAAEKNPPVVFVVAPPRSGTTLLRVLLGGHPRLFAPPELDLLAFDTLRQRAETFSGRDAFRREGLTRAVMELDGLDADAATAQIEGWEAEGVTIAETYRRLQERLRSPSGQAGADRLLVDKTPAYTFHPDILPRAEALFEGAFYLHLVRHPLAVARSFEEAKLDQIFFQDLEGRFSRREMAELTWLAGHQHVEAFLAQVPPERQRTVVFEELVRDPEPVLRDLCALLGLDFVPAMLDPYESKKERMTDGIHRGGRMLGDVKFHQHQGVDAAAAERWKGEVEDFLGEPTWALAEALGYERPAVAEGAPDRTAALGEIEPLVAAAEAAGTGAGAGPGDALPTFPLSFAQERLWVMDRLSPGLAAYNIPIAMTLDGPLEVEALQRALTEIVRRHGALRTTFQQGSGPQDDQPVQVIHPPATVPLPLEDLSAEADPLATARARAREEAATPFDLSVGPLLRARLFHLGPERHAALVTLHHIVSDGWSMGLLVEEVGRLYAAYSTADADAATETATGEGTLPELPELAIQYADFAVWQRGWLQGAVLEDHLAYWRQQLAGVPNIELPTDRPRPAVQTFRGAIEKIRVPAATVSALSALGRAEGATLFMGLAAVFATLLGRLTGQRDFALGTPVANRTRAEVEPLIGLFINTLVLRADLGPGQGDEPTFREVLQRLRRVSVEAFNHQEVPFEKILEQLQPERDPSRQALFQVMLALQNAGRQRARAGALELGHLETAEGVAKFDLTVNLSETTAEGPGAGGLVGTFEYNTDLFDRTRIQRWVRHFHALLAGITATEGAASGADRPLGALPMLSAPERHQLAQEWNDTRRPYPRDATLHGLFSAAAEDPDAVAVVLEDEEIPFEEIDQRANQLAHYLRAKGVRQDTLVALCAERAWDLMVAILGILKAGGAYVPLDPSYPAERLRFILEDTAAPVLVAHDHLLQQLPELPATLEVVHLDGDWPEIGGYSFEPPDSGVTADHLAYVMYTSGSTGRPKGVRITHRGVVRLARNDEYLDISQGSTVLQIATLAFDASTIEIWCALANGDRGGKLVLFPGDKATLGELATVLDEGGVTSAHLTTGLFQQMVDENLEGLAGLNHVLTGGDVASPIHFRRFLEAYPGKRLTNAYGPTENSVITTFRAFTQADQVGAPVSIGRPIPQTTAHVVDRKLRPMPLGCLGELVTGGDGLARDYLNRPALTAERFVPDPFSDQPGARLYRTGDLVRLRADGEFEFVGRSDHQVKVRGFRIEVGEIEAVIAQHPEVTACAVVVRHDGGPAGTEKRLAAFVVAAEEVVAAMRDYLKERLPEYMVPTLFVALEALPLTTNRKIDRKDLARRPVTGSEAAAVTAQYTAPRSATEEGLVAIWEELLGRERVGVEDDFFALGGHSLLATQMASRVEGQFGVAISLRQLFEAPTIAALAAVLEGGGDPPGEPPGHPQGVTVSKEPV